MHAISFDHPIAMATATAAASCAVSLHTRIWRCRWQSRMSVVVAPEKSEAAMKVRSSSPVASTAGCELANIWRKIQGADDWAGLVEPLNPVLRDEVVRYGELVTACYEAFELDRASPRFLECKHGKDRLLHETGLDSAGYEISRYIYATAPDILGDGGGRWIGYVAVATDEVARRLGRRDVLVAFRGTVTKSEWAANLMSSLTPARLDPHGPRPEVMVESGFLTLYTNCDAQRRRFSHGSYREQLLKEVARLVKKHEAEEMSLTLAGHSMGSALALLLGYDLAELGLNWRAEAEAVPITVYSYGGPRVGNWWFKERCDELAVKVLRVVNVRDPVTKLPGLFLNESLRRWGAAASQCYAHVGVELALDFFEVKNPACVHDMAKYVALLKCRSSICQQRWSSVGGVNWVGKAAVLLKKKIEELPMPWLFRKVGNLINYSQSHSFAIAEHFFFYFCTKLTPKC